MTAITATAREPLATPQDLEEYAGIPVATLYVWRHRGKGPRSIKVGRHLRYRWSDVDAWLRENETDHGPTDPERTETGTPVKASAPRLGRQAADQAVRDRAAARRAS